MSPIRKHRHRLAARRIARTPGSRARCQVERSLQVLEVVGEGVGSAGLIGPDEATATGLGECHEVGKMSPANLLEPARADESGSGEGPEGLQQVESGIAGGVGLGLDQALAMQAGEKHRGQLLGLPVDLGVTAAAVKPPENVASVAKVPCSSVLSRSQLHVIAASRVS